MKIKDMIEDRVNCVGIFYLKSDRIKKISMNKTILEKEKFDNVRILKEIDLEDRIILRYNNQDWSYISVEFFERARNILEEMKGGIEYIWFDKKQKNQPIVLSNGNLGIIIAPRVEE